MKNILLITYHFPPDTAVGSIRASKFAKYLPEFGWQPIILTVKEKYYGGQDEYLRDGNCAPTMIIRTNILRNPSYYYRKLKSILHIDMRAAYSDRFLNPSESKNGRLNIRKLISDLFSFPDEYAGWFPFALRKALKVIRQRDVAILMTTGPPHSVHLIGAFLKKLTGIPWIVDFRDPYIHDGINNGGLGKEKFWRKLSQRLERWYVFRADSVLTTTRRYTEELRSRYPGENEKIITLPNGYDTDDFAHIQRTNEQGFMISHFGTLYNNRNPEPLLLSLSELIHQKEIDPRGLVVRFVGRCDQEVMNSLIRKYSLSGNVEIWQWLQKDHVFEMMVRSHVLLLLAEVQPFQIPGKVYEYFAAARDILAITGEGATADLLRETGRGIVISPGDPQTLRQKIKELYIKHLSTDGNEKENSFDGAVAVTNYNRRYLTSELARFLERASRACSSVGR